MFRAAARSLAVCIALSASATARGQAAGGTQGNAPDADQVIRLLAGNPQSRARAVELWQRLPDQGIGLLPQVLAAFGRSDDAYQLRDPVRALYALHPRAVAAAVRDALAAGCTARAMLQLGADLAPDAFGDARVAAALVRGNGYQQADAAQVCAGAVAAGRLGVEPLVALVAAVPIDNRHLALNALIYVPGAWRVQLWPSQQPLLRSQIGPTVIRLFAPVREQLPAFVSEVRDVLTTGTGEEVRLVAWAIATEPEFAAELQPHLLQALGRRLRAGASSVLYALAHVDAAAAAGREPALAALASDDADAATAALACCAAWSLRDGEAQAAIDGLAQHAGDPEVRRVARILAWSLAPATHVLPPVENQVAMPPAKLAAALALADGEAPPPAAAVPWLRTLLNDYDPAITCAALVGLVRAGDDFAPGVALSALEALPAPVFARTMAAMFAVERRGPEVLGRFCAWSRAPLPLLQWLAERGDAARPAWLALAAERLRSLPHSGLDGLAAADRDWLPFAAQEAIARPAAHLRRCFGDADAPMELRMQSLRCLLGAVHRPADMHELVLLVPAGAPPELRQAFRAAALQRVGLAPDELVPLAIEALTDPALRGAALAALRAVGRGAEAAVADAWLAGDLATRCLAGILVRELRARELPLLPQALAAAVPTDDPAVRLAVAVALARRGVAAPAVELLASLRPDAPQVPELLAALAAGGADPTPHVATLARLMLDCDRHTGVAAAVLPLLLRAGEDGAAALGRALARPTPASVVLRATPMPPGLALAVLDALPRLPTDLRAGAIAALQASPGALQARRNEAAAAARTAWELADSWPERARLAAMLLALDAPLDFARSDLPRMRADSRDEVVEAAERIGLRLGEQFALDALRQQLGGAVPAERLAALRKLLTLPQLPDWMTARDLMALTSELQVQEMLAVLPHWRPHADDPDRGAFADWLLRAIAGGGVDSAMIAAALPPLAGPWSDLLAADPRRLAGLRLHLQRIGRDHPGWLAKLCPRLPKEAWPDLLLAIGNGDSPELLPDLLPLLDEDEPALAEAAYSALAVAGAAGVAHVLPLLADPRRRDMALRVLTRFGPRAAAAIEPLLAFANEKDAASSRQAVAGVFAAMGPRGLIALEQLARSGIDVVPMVTALTVSPDEATVIAALRTLAVLRPPGAFAALQQYRGGADTPRVRHWREVVLAALGHPATAAVRESLDADDAELRCHALLALGRADPPPFGRSQLLVEALWDPDARVRRAAAGLLRGDPAGARAARAIAERRAIETDDEVLRALDAR
jgi:hypothetical protein